MKLVEILNSRPDDVSSWGSPQHIEGKEARNVIMIEKAEIHEMEEGIGDIAQEEEEEEEEEDEEMGGEKNAKVSGVFIDRHGSEVSPKDPRIMGRHGTEVSSKDPRIMGRHIGSEVSPKDPRIMGRHIGSEVSPKDPRIMGRHIGSEVWENLDGLDVVLTWVDLTVEIMSSTSIWAASKNRRKNPEHHSRSDNVKVVLGGVTGYAESGHVTGVMGPSGSGKSTLLHALCGRLPPNALQTSGIVRLNGLEHKRLTFGLAAYVAQEEDLIGTLSVWESLWFSAQLRLPDNMKTEDKRAVARSALQEMGLESCADTPVGNWHLRGISGGERRRLSIALELLLRPQLLFLDEPTTGLDSASAFAVMHTLSNLAMSGRTIITTIHQPSSEAFELLDRLLLLSNGQTIFFGPRDEACNFFATSGFPCPYRRNPADHYLQCINADFDQMKSYITNPTSPLEHNKTTTIIKTLLDSYRDSQYAPIAISKAQELVSQGNGSVPKSCGSQASFKNQVVILTQRCFINMARDAGYYRLRFLVYILVSLCVGSVYYNVGTSYHALLARGSCGAFVFGFMTFMSIGGFPSFIEDMKVFHKERLNGHYGVLSFVLANSISSIPFIFVISLVSATICYFMVRLHPGFEHYAYFTLVLFCGVLIVEGLMMTIASIVPNFLMGIIIGAGVQGIFMLLSGFFRLPNDIPDPIWKYPLLYMSFDYWALQGQYQNDLHGMIFQDQYGQNITGDEVLIEMFQIDTNRSKWSDLSVIISMTFIYRIIFFVLIKLNEEIIPWMKGYLAKKALSRKRLYMYKHGKNTS